MVVNEGENAPVDDRADDELAVLRAKYLDYCSAQLAGLLLHLSPDEIFVLSEKVAAGDADTTGSAYGRIARVATEWLADRVALPPFEVWLDDYRAHPERYDAYLMGLWEEPGLD